jgi:hypothetical protein
MCLRTELERLSKEFADGVISALMHARVTDIVERPAPRLGVGQRGRVDCRRRRWRRVARPRVFTDREPVIRVALHVGERIRVLSVARARRGDAHPPGDIVREFDPSAPLETALTAADVWPPRMLQAVRALLKPASTEGLRQTAKLKRLDAKIAGDDSVAVVADPIAAGIEIGR